ncbi:unnamed protein product [Musa acuminata var. zebrina]
MDLEGTDGSERGEDDTAFEKQSALFALAVSDIVLINMWCHDIGREQAANKPLLKTIFQVMMRLFSPRKTTLLFGIQTVTKEPKRPKNFIIPSHLVDLLGTDGELYRLQDFHSALNIYGRLSWRIRTLTFLHTRLWWPLYVVKKLPMKNLLT